MCIVVAFFWSYCCVVVGVTRHVLRLSSTQHVQAAFSSMKYVLLQDSSLPACSSTADTTPLSVCC
jgi:hypothetical protein